MQKSTSNPRCTSANAGFIININTQMRVLRTMLQIHASNDSYTNKGSLKLEYIKQRIATKNEHMRGNKGLMVQNQVLKGVQEDE